MPDRNRNILLSCGVLLLATCICISILLTGGAGVFLRGISPASTSTPTTQVQANATPITLLATATPEPTLAPTAAPAVSATPGPTAESTPTAEKLPLPPDIAAEMNTIQAQVEQIRGLPPLQPVERALLSHDQLDKRVRADFAKDNSPEDNRKTSLLLTAFGLLEPGFDLNSFYQSFLSEQIAGFYDPEAKQMYIVQGQSFGGMERMTYSHEYTHALQDQHYDIRNGLRYNNSACKEESERCTAVQALIEGDASLAEQAWMIRFATQQDRQDLSDFSKNNSLPVFESAPPFMKDDLLFPYVQGLEFVQSLYDQNGWESVNAAFANPPVSGEQILHPEKYPQETPAAVQIPDLKSVLGDGWTEIDRGTLGEWYTYLMLADGITPSFRLPQRTAQQAAKGWGGDAYISFEKDGSMLLVLETTWDSAAEASEFSKAFQTYADSRWGKPAARADGKTSWSASGSFSLFSLAQSQTIWIMAPDEQLALAISSAMKGGS
jgi:hypothetical protein